MESTRGDTKSVRAVPGGAGAPKLRAPRGAAEGRLPEKETERLLLRQFSPDDLCELARIFGDARVMEYIGIHGGPITREETEVALRSIIAHWGRHGFGRWAAVHKEEGRLIGYCGLRALGEYAELVYLLDHPYWGRGLATEMARATLAFGFEQKSFDRIVGMTRPGNAASRRVLEKVGMSYRQTLQFFRHMAETGTPCANAGGCEDFDVVRYEISRAEYWRQWGRGLRREQ